MGKFQIRTKPQKELAKAKNTLREVEDHIQKVEGKPTANGPARFGSDRNWLGVRNNEDDESPAPKRQLRLSETEANSRKRIFPSVADIDETPAKKKSFPSVVGEVKLNDLNITLKRGRDRKEQERLVEDGGSKPRSVFARLSGPHIKDVDTVEEDDDEDNTILRRQPTLSSRVFPISHPTPSREQVMAAQKKDEAGKQRDRRMFGALVGTLQRFRREETQEKELKAKRQEIEKKLEEDALREKERIQQEKRALLTERRRREGDIKRIEWSLNRVKEFAAWEASMLPLNNFIQTEATPHIFFLPKVHTPRSLELLEKSKGMVRAMIDKRLASLNDEIETSEKKAKRAAGELDESNNGVNKENETHDDGDHFQSEELDDRLQDHEEADADWSKVMAIEGNFETENKGECVVSSVSESYPDDNVAAGPPLPPVKNAKKEQNGEHVEESVENPSANKVDDDILIKEEMDQTIIPAIEELPIIHHPITPTLEKVVEHSEPSNVENSEVPGEKHEQSSSSDRKSRSRSKSRRSKSKERKSRSRSTSKSISPKQSKKSPSNDVKKTVKKDTIKSTKRSRSRDSKTHRTSPSHRSRRSRSVSRRSTRTSNRRQRRLRSPKRSPQKRSPKRSTKHSPPSRSRKRHSSTSSSSSSSSVNSDSE